MNPCIQSIQQISQIGSQSNLLDFFGPDNTQSQKAIDILRSDSHLKQQKKKYLVAKKVQPNNIIRTIQEDGELDYSPQNFGSNQHNAYDILNLHNRRNSSIVTPFKNNEFEVKTERNYSQEVRKSIEGKQSIEVLERGQQLNTPNLQNISPINQSLNNSLGYSPQINTGYNQQLLQQSQQLLQQNQQLFQQNQQLFQQQNQQLFQHQNQQQSQRKYIAPPYMNGNSKSLFDRPSSFQQYLKEKEYIDQSNFILSGAIRSNNLNDSVNQNIQLIESIDDVSPQRDKNIFLKHNLHFNSVQENGPRFDHHGKIIPRSIVGKPEWYVKNQGSKLTKEDLSIFNTKKPRKQSQSISIKSRSVQRINIKNTAKIQQEVKITKFQLEKQLDTIRQRIKDNIEVEKKIIGNFNATDKLRYTQQQRNLEKFEEIEKKWMNFIENSCNKLNRDYSQSQLLSQDVYRQKKEMTDVFEKAKVAFDLFGERVWYMSLRNDFDGQKNEEEQRDVSKSKQPFNMNPLVVLEDIPLAFNKALPQGIVNRQLEIVRKPLITFLNQSLKISKSVSQSSLINQSQISSNPFKSFDSMQYYNQRLKGLRDDLKFHKKVQIEKQIDVDNLAIIGVSQLQREQDMLFNSPLDLFDHKKQESEQYTDEIIEMNYDKQGIHNEGSLKDFTLPLINKSQINSSMLK